MWIVLIICCDSWLPHLWTVFNPYFFLCVLQGFLLFCSQVFTVFLFTCSSLKIMVSALCAFSFKLGNYCIFVLWSCTAPASPIQFTPCQLKREMPALLSTVDNHLFSFPFIFLRCNEAGSQCCRKTSNFSETLIQPLLSSLLCSFCFAWSSWSLKMIDKSTTKPFCFHFVQLIDSPAFLC